MELIDCNDKARLAEANAKLFDRLIARMEQTAEQRRKENNQNDNC